MGPRTLCIHGGRDSPDEGGLALPVFPAVVGSFSSLDQTVDTFEGARPGFIYSRFGHPTGSAVESRLAALEGTESAVLLSSGMTAITLSILTYCESGDHLLTSPEHYGGVTDFLRRFAPRHGIEVESVPLPELGNLKPRIRENTRMVLVESPTNPLMHVVDLKALMAGLGNRRPLVALDATLATPLGQDSVGTGCDLILHSATKYLGGHDDLTAGVVLGSEEVVAPIRDRRKVLGAITDPQTAWLLDRGLKTLAVRWERQCANAAGLAERLEEHDAVERVYYPGLPSHPHHQLARTQMKSFGAILTFEVQGGLDGARTVFDRLELIARAPSLGGVESMMLHPATASHRGLPPKEREELGITEGLLRLSAGIEDLEDLWKDLERALG